MWKRADEVPKENADAILEHWDQSPTQIQRMIVLQFSLDRANALGLLSQAYAQIGNHAPAERRHAVTPGVRDAIRDFLREQNP